MIIAFFGSSLPRGAKILPCRLTQSNNRDIYFYLLMAIKLAPQGKEVPVFPYTTEILEEFFIPGRLQKPIHQSVLPSLFKLQLSIHCIFQECAELSTLEVVRLL